MIEFVTFLADVAFVINNCFRFSSWVLHLIDKLLVISSLHFRWYIFHVLTWIWDICFNPNLKTIKRYTMVHDNCFESVLFALFVYLKCKRHVISSCTVCSMGNINSNNSNVKSNFFLIRKSRTCQIKNELSD